MSEDAKEKADRHVADTERVVSEWVSFRNSTPIAAETFMPVTLVAALDDLAEEAGPRR